MRSFTTIPNGDCLYHSFAVSLFVAYYQGRLCNAINNPTFRAAIADLIKEAKPELFNPKASAKAQMKALAGSFLSNGKVDWINLQLALAPALRKMVVQGITDNPELSGLVKEELYRALDYSLEISTNTDVEVVECFNGFDNLKTTIQKLKTMKPELTLDEQKSLLKNWFDKIGFGLYLQGPKGIAKKGIYAGVIEANVLSKLWNVRLDYYSRGFHDLKNRKTFEAFNAARSQRKIITFALELHGDHWDALFSEKDKKAARFVQQYTPEFNKYQAKQERKFNRLVQQNILKQFGTFKAHHSKCLENMSESDYCGMQGLTSEQYHKNIISGKKYLREFIESSRLVMSSEFVVSNEPAASSETAASSEPVVLSESAFLENNVESDSIVNVEKPDVVSGHITPDTFTATPFDANNYFTMLIGFAAVMSFGFHCLALPSLFPFMHCADLLTNLITFVFSLGASAFITEKFQASNGNGFLKEFKPPPVLLPSRFEHKNNSSLSHAPLVELGPRTLLFSKFSKAPLPTLTTTAAIVSHETYSNKSRSNL